MHSVGGALRGKGVEWALCVGRGALFHQGRARTLSGGARIRGAADDVRGAGLRPLKSQAFAESLAWQVGVKPGALEGVDFRIKREGRPANHSTSAPVKRVRRNGTQAALWTSSRGNWGHVAFQPGACDFCDDVVGETADVSIGDAWLARFMSDDRGTNVVVSRNRQVDQVLKDAVARGEVEVFPLSVDEAVKTQAGGFRYRREGLAIRLADDVGEGKSVPRKRVSPAVKGLRSRRARLMRQRRRMARISHSAFAQARQKGNLEIYLGAMRREITLYRSLEASHARRAWPGMRSGNL